MKKTLITLMILALTGCSAGSQWSSGWVKLNSGETIQCSQIVHMDGYINCDGRKFPMESITEYDDGQNYYGEP